MSRRKTANRDLPPLPTHAEIARAMLSFDGDDVRFGKRWFGEVSANALAGSLGVRGARRAGRGAVKGSWSGTMSGSLRLVPALRAMERRGLIRVDYDKTSYRNLYRLTDAGRALAVESEAVAPVRVTAVTAAASPSTDRSDS